MGAISAQLSPVPLHCIDDVDLASKPIGSLLTGDLAYVESMKSADNGPFYFLDLTSTLPVDGMGVLATSGSNGRWLSLLLYNGLLTTNPASSGSAALVQPRTVTVNTTGGPGAVILSLAGILPAGVALGVDYTVSVLVVDASNPPELYRVDLNATYQVDNAGLVLQVGTTATANARNTAGLMPPAIDATLNGGGSLVLTYPGGIDLYWTCSISALYHLAQP